MDYGRKRGRHDIQAFAIIIPCLPITRTSPTGSFGRARTHARSPISKKAVRSMRLCAPSSLASKTKTTNFCRYKEGRGNQLPGQKLLSPGCYRPLTPNTVEESSSSGDATQGVVDRSQSALFDALDVNMLEIGWPQFYPQDHQLMRQWSRPKGRSVDGKAVASLGL